MLASTVSPSSGDLYDSLGDSGNIRAPNEKVAHSAVTQGTEAPPSGGFSWHPAKSQNKPLTGLSNILDAFDSLRWNSSCS